jgi:spermidine synthase
LNFAALPGEARAPRLPRYSIDVSEGAGVRYLHFGSEWIQGAMRIARPFALELEYTREMMLPLLLEPNERWPENILIIGLGAASITKFLHRHCPQATLTVVEIDPRMPAAAASYFRLPPEDGRLRIVIDDGAAFIARHEGLWDLILVDGYDHRARANALDTDVFHRNCRARLAPGGRTCLNLFGRARGFRASAQRVLDAYDGHALVLPSLNEGNAICIAAAESDDGSPMDVLRTRAQALRAATGLNLAPSLSRIEKAGYCPGGRMTI